MKKAAKRIIGIVSAICVAVSMLMVCDIPAQAATDKAPAKVHIGLKQTYSNSIEVKFSQGDYKIQNVKSSSKNLTYRVTDISSTSSERTYDKEKPWGYGRIGLYAKKKGTYKVTFDVVDKDMNVTSSHSVKVYANKETGIKKITFAGKDVIYTGGICSSGSGAFKVTMNKGYTLKSITMTAYNKSGKAAQKKIKNGAKVTLGKYRYISEKTDTSYSNWWYADFLAQTKFEIVYKDKYSGQLVTEYRNFFRLPQN